MHSVVADAIISITPATIDMLADVTEGWPGGEAGEGHRSSFRKENGGAPCAFMNATRRTAQ